MQAWQTAAPVPLPAAAPPRRVQVFDSASRRLVPAGPETGAARMYVCGITPYDATHLGHAATYVAFDLLHRAWRDAGLDVTYVQNVTDVDDPLLERAAATGVGWRQLAAEQVELYRADMAALNVLPPAVFAGVVESMPLVVDLVGRLQEAGVVYAVDDPEHPDLYFAAERHADLGFLSHLDEPAARDLFAERGGDPDRTGKKSPLDWLLWRTARAGEPAWDSPLGAGRPGWHVECTAIALRHLGPDFDVQAGGRDLVFPHHEMSAAEGAAVTGRPFARAYVHAGMVGLDGEKMSKSLGNLVFVSRLRAAGEDPMAIRLVLLAHHYRDDWFYTDRDLAGARDRLQRWRAAVRLEAALDAGEVLAQVRAALATDLDAPTALAAVDAWADRSLASEPGGRVAADPAAPALVARICDTLLGVRL